MTKNQMVANVIYLVDKYIPKREDLRNLIRENPGAVKGVLAELSLHHEIEFSEKDSELIRDIAYYFV